MPKYYTCKPNVANRSVGVKYFSSNDGNKIILIIEGKGLNFDENYNGVCLGAGEDPIIIVDVNSYNSGVRTSVGYSNMGASMGVGSSSLGADMGSSNYNI